jgi:hypothetical protein
MRTRHSGFGTHKIDEATPRDSTRGRNALQALRRRQNYRTIRTIHRRCAADHAHTMRRPCAADPPSTAPTHGPHPWLSGPLCEEIGPEARKSDPRTVRGGRCYRRVAPTRWPSGLCTDLNTRRPRAWTSMHAASMDEHGDREHGRAWRQRAWTSMEAASMEAASARRGRMGAVSFMTIPRSCAAGRALGRTRQDWASLGAGDQANSERSSGCMRGHALHGSFAGNNLCAWRKELQEAPSRASPCTLKE